jgi:hypothetical protein
MWSDALAGLGRTLVRDGLSQALGLGDRAEGDPDPGALLKEADRLWKQGAKAEAATIYKRIRKEFKLTLVYTLNRDRIKKRGHYREDG